MKGQKQHRVVFSGKRAAFGKLRVILKVGTCEQHGKARCLKAGGKLTRINEILRSFIDTVDGRIGIAVSSVTGIQYDTFAHGVDSPSEVV
jgi:hypothetical protein